MTRDQAFNPMRALESAWQILMKAPLPMWVGGLLLVMIQQFGGAGANFQFDGNSGSEVWLFVLPMIGLGLFMAVVVMLATSWLSVGYYCSIREVMRTGTAEFEDVINPRGRWMQMFLTRLIQMALVLAAMLPFAVPPTVGLMLSEGLGMDDEVAVGIAILGVLVYLPVLIYIVCGLIFMPYVAALEDVAVTETAGRSWDLARGHRWRLILFGIVTWVLAVLGLMMCCVGVIPAGILIEVMWCEAYVQATDIVGDPEEWWIEGQTSYARRYGRDGRPVARTIESAPGERADSGTPSSSEEPFDPGRWRGDADIPPIDGPDGPGSPPA